jgi:hypothetical protein
MGKNYVVDVVTGTSYWIVFGGGSEGAGLNGPIPNATRTITTINTTTTTNERPIDTATPAFICYQKKEFFSF